MEIIQLYQGNTRTCGQHAVAMVTGQPIEEVYEVFGHKKGTTTAEVVAALRQFGLNCSDTRVAIGRKPMPELCIITVMDKGVRHWAAYHESIVYCSSLGTHYLEDYMEQFHSRIFSCIKIQVP